VSIESVERLIVGEAIPPENVRQARQDLKSLLMGELASSQEDATLAQVIANLAEDKIPYPVAAAYLVRFLAVSNLIPESNSANQIQRNVVAICEKSLPNLCSYVRINEKKQTFDKFNLLRSTHHRICEILSPLSVAPADLESLVGAKQSFLQVLNHTIVNSYCSPFGISRIRFGVEAMLVKLAKLNTSTVNFAVDLRECEASLTDQIAFCSENSNFLTNGHFRPFLSATRSALDKFTEGARGRFIATLLHRLPPNNTLQKRYPLQEGRQIAVTVPVRNDGPGLALAVKASIETNETDSDDVAFREVSSFLEIFPRGIFQ
jgi:hypothetical protein